MTNLLGGAKALTVSGLGLSLVFLEVVVVIALATGLAPFLQPCHLGNTCVIGGGWAK